MYITCTSLGCYEGLPVLIYVKHFKQCHAYNKYLSRPWRCLSVSALAHTPSIRISMTSFTLKLSSSTSWPTYWYSARHLGPWIRGWGLGRPTPGTGRCPTLRFLCMLWAHEGTHHSPRHSPSHSWGCPSTPPTQPRPGQAH